MWLSEHSAAWAISIAEAVPSLAISLRARLKEVCSAGFGTVAGEVGGERATRRGDARGVLRAKEWLGGDGPLLAIPLAAIFAMLVAVAVLPYSPRDKI
jgi:hypothetical protein